MGSVLNVVPVGLALLAWGLFAILLAHAYGLRLLLGAGLLLLSGYLASLLLLMQGAHWEQFLARPEIYVVVAMPMYAVPWLTYRRDRNDFGFVYRLCGAFLAFNALLTLSFEG